MRDLELGTAASLNMSAPRQQRLVCSRATSHHCCTCAVSTLRSGNMICTLPALHAHASGQQQQLVCRLHSHVIAADMLSPSDYHGRAVHLRDAICSHSALPALHVPESKQHLMCSLQPIQRAA